MRHRIGPSLAAVTLFAVSTASAQTAGDRETAKSYYVRLVTVAAPADTQRPELAQAKAFLGSK